MTCKTLGVVYAGRKGKRTAKKNVTRLLRDWEIGRKQRRGWHWRWIGEAQRATVSESDPRP